MATLAEILGNTERVDSSSRAPAPMLGQPFDKEPVEKRFAGGGSHAGWDVMLRRNFADADTDKWIATRVDADGPGWPAGYGETEDEAIYDLIDAEQYAYSITD